MLTLRPVFGLQTDLHAGASIQTRFWVLLQGCVASELGGRILEQIFYNTLPTPRIPIVLLVF